MSNSVVFSKHFGAGFAQGNVIYYVEAKNGNRWKEVAGPFNSRAKAEQVAHDYAIDNNVVTRVIGRQ
jgi:hypothetical protein